MQGYGNGVNAYRQAQVGTADPRRLVVMCYEHVIKQLDLAQRNYESCDYEAKAQALAKVQDTVELLLQSLDTKKGGQIADSLQALYTYALRRLTEGDLKKDMAVFKEVSKLFEELLESWKALPLPQGDSAQGEKVTVGQSKLPDEVEPSRAMGGI